MKLQNVLCKKYSRNVKVLARFIDIMNNWLFKFLIVRNTYVSCFQICLILYQHDRDSRVSPTVLVKFWNISQDAHNIFASLCEMYIYIRIRSSHQRYLPPPTFDVEFQAVFLSDHSLTSAAVYATWHQSLVALHCHINEKNHCSIYFPID